METMQQHSKYASDLAVISASPWDILSHSVLSVTTLSLFRRQNTISLCICKFGIKKNYNITQYDHFCSLVYLLCVIVKTNLNKYNR